MNNKQWLQAGCLTLSLLAGQVMAAVAPTRPRAWAMN